jgi:hypothetical protein
LTFVAAGSILTRSAISSDKPARSANASSGANAQHGRGDETYVTVKLHIGSRHRAVHRHGRADSGMRVRLRGEHDNARRNLGFSGGRLVG